MSAVDVVCRNLSERVVGRSPSVIRYHPGSSDRRSTRLTGAVTVWPQQRSVRLSSTVYARSHNSSILQALVPPDIFLSAAS